MGKATEDQVYDEVMGQLGLVPDCTIEFQAVIDLAYKLGQGITEEQMSAEADTWMARMSDYWKEYLR